MDAAKKEKKLGCGSETKQFYPLLDHMLNQPGLVSPFDQLRMRMNKSLVQLLQGKSPLAINSLSLYFFVIRMWMWMLSNVREQFNEEDNLT